MSGGGVAAAGWAGGCAGGGPAAGDGVAGAPSGVTGSDRVWTVAGSSRSRRYSAPVDECGTVSCVPVKSDGTSVELAKSGVAATEAARNRLVPVRVHGLAA